MMMPVMSGAEFLATLRSDDRYREVPAIVVSAWPGEGATRAAQAVLAKPVDLGELVRTIERVVHKVRGTSSGS
jgi:CheY-like chemotaxis protein